MKVVFVFLVLVAIASAQHYISSHHASSVRLGHGAPHLIGHNSGHLRSGHALPLGHSSEIRSYHHGSLGHSLSHSRIVRSPQHHGSYSSHSGSMAGRSHGSYSSHSGSMAARSHSYGHASGMSGHRSSHSGAIPAMHHG